MGIQNESSVSSRLLSTHPSRIQTYSSSAFCVYLSHSDSLLQLGKPARIQYPEPISAEMSGSWKNSVEAHKYFESDAMQMSREHVSVDHFGIFYLITSTSSDRKAELRPNYENTIGSQGSAKT